MGRDWLRSALCLTLAAAVLASAADAKPKKKPAPKPDDEEEASEPAKADTKPKADRPFASAGYLAVPTGKDIRMGDPSGGLAIVAKGGSLIKRQNKSLVLDGGKMGVSMKNGKAAIRLVSGALSAETAGGKFTLERTEARIRVSVLEGKVLVSGAGAPRTLTGGQRLDLAGGKVTTGAVAEASLDSDLEWIAAK